MARVLIHLPEPNKHLVRFYGAYANRVRSALRDADANQTEPATPPTRRTLNKRWAQLIHRIYDVDPLVCTRCGDTMKVIAFITDPEVIRAILEHRETALARQRAPPTREPTSVH